MGLLSEMRCAVVGFGWRRNEIKEWKKKAAVVQAHACLTNSWLRMLRWREEAGDGEVSSEEGLYRATAASVPCQQTTHLVSKVRQRRNGESPLRAGHNLLSRLPAVELTGGDPRPERG